MGDSLQTCRICFQFPKTEFPEFLANIKKSKSRTRSLNDKWFSINFSSFIQNKHGLRPVSWQQSDCSGLHCVPH
jgi:hypothetical protein